MEMTSFIQLILILAVILLTAKLAGVLSMKIGQPTVLGKLIVGIILGPTALNIVGWPIITDIHLGDTIYHLGELGVLLLMFLAGLELDLRDMLKSSKVALLAGVSGVIMPILMSYLFGLTQNMPVRDSLFLGIVLAATSVSISAQTLFELDVLRSKVGLGLLGAAVFDDILVILLLSVFTALMSGAGGALVILWTILRMVLYLVGASLVGMYVLPWIARKSESLGISQSLVAVTIVVMLIFSFTAEALGGMAAITGAFLAGIMYGRTTQKRGIDTGVRVLAYAFFVPIFFVDIGLRVNLREIPLSGLWILLAIVLIAIVSKILGCGGGAKLGGYSWRESLQLGIGMISRGEVGLIVASVGTTAGVLAPEMFSLIVGMVLATTLVTPPLLRWSFKSQMAESKEAA